MSRFSEFGKMYRASIARRARAGTQTHGSIAAYANDFQASNKAFEFFVADKLTRERGVPFCVWEELDPEIKAARGLTRADTGIDVTDGVSCAVQCKLRSASLTWRECSTFFGSAQAAAASDIEDANTVIQWPNMLLARNACSTLSRNFVGHLGAKRDMPVPVSEFRAYLEECDAVVPVAPVAPVAPVDEEVLRDYQSEAIELCCNGANGANGANGPAYVVLPTGAGKNVIIVRSAEQILREQEATVLVLVPRIVLMEQLKRAFERRGISVDCVGDSLPRNLGARVTLCVFDSVHKVNVAGFTRILIDEAHMAKGMLPVMYAELVESESVEPDSVEPDSVESDSVEPDSVESDSADLVESVESAESVESGESAESAKSVEKVHRISAKVLMSPKTCLFSATLDIPSSTPPSRVVTRSLRELIEAGYLEDYQIHVPVLDEDATDATLARHLYDNYDSMLVFTETRKRGLALCAALNRAGSNGANGANGPSGANGTFASGFVAKYIDCKTSREDRAAIIDEFTAGTLAFIVNVRVLSVGFDAPITKGVCFVSMPVSKTHIIQVVGRCLRKHPDKRMASVVLPFVTGHDDGSRACDFFRILAQNDTRLKRALARDGLGYVDVWTPSGGAGPLLLRDEIADSVHRAARCKLDAMIDALRAHYEEHGALPKGRNTPLGRWTAFQRANRDTMSAERRDALQALTFWTWRASETAEEKWHRMCTRLAAHVETHGAMPTTANDKRLYVWAYTQSLRRAQLSDGQISKLEAIRSDFFEPRSLADCTVLSPRPISTIGELFQTSSTGSGAFLSRWLSHPTARGR